MPVGVAVDALVPTEVVTFFADAATVLTLRLREASVVPELLLKLYVTFTVPTVDAAVTVTVVAASSAAVAVASVENVIEVEPTTNAECVAPGT